MTLESSEDSYSFTYKVINYDYFEQTITVQNVKFAKKPKLILVWAFYSLKFNYNCLYFKNLESIKINLKIISMLCSKIYFSLKLAKIVSLTSNKCDSMALTASTSSLLAIAL